MFTGLVKEVGKIRSIMPNTEGIRFLIQANVLRPQMQIDDSVAVNGVCQTVTELGENSFIVQAVQTTMQKTTFSKLKINDAVNLELALRASDRLGGHIVQGHVNDIGQIVSIKHNGKSLIIDISLKEEWFTYIIDEGSIAVDGISLTVAKVNRVTKSFQLAIIPHTVQSTILQFKKVGDWVNIEVDVLAKYVENILLNRKESISTSNVDKVPLDEKWLRKHGF